MNTSPQPFQNFLMNKDDLKQMMQVHNINPQENLFSPEEKSTYNNQPIQDISDNAIRSEFEIGDMKWDVYGNNITPLQDKYTKMIAQNDEDETFQSTDSDEEIVNSLDKENQNPVYSLYTPLKPQNNNIFGNNQTILRQNSINRNRSPLSDITPPLPRSMMKMEKSMMLLSTPKQQSTIKMGISSKKKSDVQLFR